jgi:hypothetical protein
MNKLEEHKQKLDILRGSIEGPASAASGRLSRIKYRNLLDEIDDAHYKFNYEFIDMYADANGMLDSAELSTLNEAIRMAKRLIDKEHYKQLV